MFNAILLKRTALLVIFIFVFFTFSANYTFAQQEEDALLKARQLYQQGDYEGSIQLLVDFITKVKKIVEQKKNVAMASYLLAKIYYTVGEDKQAVESLKYVYTLYPAFVVEESNLAFKELAKKVKKGYLETRKVEVKEEEPEPAKKEPPPAKVIEQPGKKKAKKFPVILVVGGIAVAALVVLLLSGGKKERTTEPEEQYDIRGLWEIRYKFHQDDTWHTEPIEFNGSRTSGTTSWNNFNYTVTGRHVRCEGEWQEEGTTIYFVIEGDFTGPDNMAGDVTALVTYPGGAQVTLTGEWNAHRIEGQTALSGSTGLVQTVQGLVGRH